VAIDRCSLFKTCGIDVIVHPDSHIEHPDLIEVGDHVRFGKGFYCGESSRLRIGSSVTFMPGCFVQGRGLLQVDDDVTFFPGTYIATGGEDGVVSVGGGSHFAPGCSLYGAGGLRVGRYCNIASHVVLTTVGHDPLRRHVPMSLAEPIALPITLANDVWIGANATVVSGVRVAEGTIIGANSVVLSDTEPYCLYAGVPALRKKERIWAREEA
jgi:acetyltransferase-like isoleucine patch superfamily enzyme